MTKGTTFVGLDAHKKSINVAMLAPEGGAPVEWELPNEPGAVRRMVHKLLRAADGGEVRCCYEAGPCGFALQRQMEKEGVVCEVVAPSLIPVKAGDRIKTDRRDAKKLAELFRAGLLTEVRPPTDAEEAARNLCRCREDAKEDLTRSKHRLSKMLLRRGLAFRESNAWGTRHIKWLRTLRFERLSDQAVFDDYLLAIDQLQQRVERLEEKIEELAQQEPHRQPVAWLRCFRGIDTITAMTIVAELHGFERFTSARQLMAYLGLVPSEHSSSDKTRRGSITKTGNAHVRRVLVEAAWHYRHQPATSQQLRKRRAGAASGDHRAC